LLIALLERQFQLSNLLLCLFFVAFLFFRELQELGFGTLVCLFRLLVVLVLILDTVVFGDEMWWIGRWH
jgi:hypothetical protein